MDWLGLTDPRKERTQNSLQADRTTRATRAYPTMQFLLVETLMGEQ